MCGRYSLTSPTEAMRQLFRFEGRPNLPLRFNIAPTQTIAIVRQEGDQGKRQLAPVRWGLVPSWAKQVGPGPALINARIETVLEKPSFRAAVRRRRCLIPADGFYEWQGQGGGAKRPYRIVVRGGELFAFAGLWERWGGTDGDIVESATILTMDANQVLKPIHGRMPVILDPVDYDRWLDVKDNPAEDAIASITQIPEPDFAAYEVSRHVNNVRNDDELCIEPVAEQPRLI